MVAGKVQGQRLQRCSGSRKGLFASASLPSFEPIQCVSTVPACLPACERPCATTSPAPVPHRCHTNLRDVGWQPWVAGCHCHQVLGGSLGLCLLQRVVGTWGACVAGHTICTKRDSQPRSSPGMQVHLHCSAPRVVVTHVRPSLPSQLACSACSRLQVASTSACSAATCSSRSASSVCACFSCEVLAVSEACRRSSCLRNGGKQRNGRAAANISSGEQACFYSPLSKASFPKQACPPTPSAALVSCHPLT